ncbi:protein-L-isoaspartate O-methyltransferase [Halobaculum sp. MBLA0143]|uniref:protein-L-isoaspartate O-methyltransferase family protein n=1 Tax=Halobaculum sp. MBLA0143 TaxID=3079933 RepID=UPI003524CB81
MDSPDPELLREDMLDGVEHSLGRAPSDPVREAMARVPRHEFVAEAPYANRTGQQGDTRVLSPATVVRFLDVLAATPDDEVLVVGAGVGYTAAVLAEIVGPRRVHAVDIARGMVQEARDNLAAAGYDAVLVDRTDGSDGLARYAPYDRVLVEGAVVSPPSALLDQLTPDGRLVVPRGRAGGQEIVAVEVDGDSGGETVADGGDVALRPLLAEGEQPGAPVRNRTRREDREFERQGYFARTGWEQEWIDWEKDG